MSLNKGVFVAIAAAATGALVSNLDRIEFTTKTEVAVNFEDNQWLQEPQIALQESFQEDVLAFAEKVKKNLPPRNVALDQHASISSHCRDFFNATRYNGSHAFYSSSQQKTRDCLNAVEDSAIKTKTKYDMDYIEKALEYARSDYPGGKPPALKK